MKWLSRDEWRDAFKDVLDLHLVPACDVTSMKVEEAVSILDQEQLMSTVWGCAFEEFLTREFDNGRNIVDDYLKRRGWKENASTRSYMSALRTSVMSLYEVSNVIKDTSCPTCKQLLQGLCRRAQKETYAGWSNGID